MTAPIVAPASPQTDKTSANETEASVISSNVDILPIGSSTYVPTGPAVLAKEESNESTPATPSPENAKSTQLDFTKMEANSKNPFASLTIQVADDESGVSSDDDHGEPDGTQVLDAQAEIDDKEDSDEWDTDSVTFSIDNGPAQTTFVRYVPHLRSTVVSGSMSTTSLSSTTTFDSEGSDDTPQDTGLEMAHQVAQTPLPAGAFDVFKRSVLLR